MTRTTPIAEHASSLPWPITIAAGDAQIAGDLVVPDRAHGLVIFAHGSGSSRHSPRNRSVADVMAKAGLATLLLDLLTEAEERIDRVTAELRFDIPFLAARVTSAIDWVRETEQTRDLTVGLFGASTGAAAALVAASNRPDRVRAVVSRGGRPDLAGAALHGITAPTLLIVGSRDVDVIKLNREAMDRMTTMRQLEVIPGATHLFEEPGAIDAVAQAATDWFLKYL